MARLAKALSTALVALLLIGCAWVEDNPTTARLLVTQGVMRSIEASDDWPAKAAQYRAGADAVLDYSTDVTVSIELLREMACVAVKCDEMAPADREAAAFLFDSLTSLAEDRARDLAPEERLATLREIASWVIYATGHYR